MQAAAATPSRSSVATELSTRLDAPPDASRAEPYVMILESAAGFAAPAGHSGANGGPPGRASFAGSGGAGSSDTLPRSQSAPFSVPLTSRVRAPPPLRCCVLRAVLSQLLLCAACPEASCTGSVVSMYKTVASLKLDRVSSMPWGRRARLMDRPRVRFCGSVFRGGHTNEQPCRPSELLRATCAEVLVRAGRVRSDQRLSIGRVLPHHVSALPQGALRRLHEEMTAEQRLRLIAGMKRYAYRKRHEGAARTCMLSRRPANPHAGGPRTSVSLACSGTGRCGSSEATRGEGCIGGAVGTCMASTRVRWQPPMHQLLLTNHAMKCVCRIPGLLCQSSAMLCCAVQAYCPAWG